MNPVVNTYLAAPKAAITHFDSSQSDSLPFPVPSGESTVHASLPLTPALPQAVNGPINIMTLASPSPDYMWGVTWTGITYISTSGNAFTPVARLPVPGLTQFPIDLLVTLLTQPLDSPGVIEGITSQLSPVTPSGGINSAYCLVDNTNTLFANYGTKVYAVGLNDPDLPLLGIGIKRTLDTSAFIPEGQAITGLVLTYDGNLVVLGTRSISVVSRTFSGPVHTLTLGADEYVSNSAAVDEHGGIYVVSDKLMHKVVWTGSTLSADPADGAWVSSYPTGDTYPTIFGSGSGATPTLMGFGSDADKLVVITDGKKRMSLVAFWRDAIPTGFSERIAGIIPVTCGLPLSTAYIQSDQSVAIQDYGAFVVNNVGAGTGTGVALTDALARGPILDSPQGVERFAWDPVSHSWSSTWSRADICSNTMIPAISSASNTVYTSGYYRHNGGWKVVGMDWNTGQTVHSTVFNDNICGNGIYAQMEFMPDGDLLMNSILGPMRVQLPGGTVLPL
ncbi:TPA: hypothetical protein O8U43_003690 [Enterobacter cloacae]|nr:hypothetical protein [Enterobacter cloacae]HDC4444477.1 hypothetical protein [Enterobacter cloacae]HDC4666255.1 hypothetical protein [Enterobacter cloacae]